MILSSISGKKIKIIPTIIIVFFILLSNLFTPSGKILYTLGYLAITDGALGSGMFKGTTLIGLIYLSRFSVSYNLKFPGSFGGTIGKVFYYFEQLTESKIRITPHNFIENIDKILIQIEKNDNDNLFPIPSVKTEGFPPIPLILIVLVNWGALILNLSGFY